MFKINDELVKMTMFPDGTSQAWKLPEHLFDRMTVNIDWKFDHEGEVIQLAQIADLFRANGTPKINLHMDFLPYARQDKPISNTATFALATFAKIINSCNFNKVTTYDVHSKVALKLISKLESTIPYDVVNKTIKETRATLIAYPDQSAYIKYVNDDQNCIWAVKVREPLTGNIMGLEINNPLVVNEKRVLIVDDICDGGATFKAISEKLLTLGAVNVDLYVTHGIFSKGLDTLRESGINRIFTRVGEVSQVQGNLAYKEI